MNRFAHALAAWDRSETGDIGVIAPFADDRPTVVHAWLEQVQLIAAQRPVLHSALVSGR